MALFAAYGALASFYNTSYSTLLRLGLRVFISPVSAFFALLIFAIVLTIIAMVFAYSFGWIERKTVARMQSRHGPTYLGKFGILQNMADVIKLLSKENIVPYNSDFLFPFILPIVYAMFFLILFFIPFGKYFIGLDSSVALIFIFMLISFMPLLLFLAGWTSGNKFGAISAQRSVLMLLSYEIPLVLVVASVAMLAHSYSLVSIVSAQSRIWFAVLMPIGFALFFIIMLAELERPPFDLREADNELIAGWLTDVGAPYYALALFLDYTRMFVGTLLIAVLFLGGGSGPLLPSFAWIIIKVLVLSFIIMLVRATEVRVRISRLLRMGWLYFMPLSVLNIFITFALFVR
ncbi:MAG: complex I subunit 1/NuoH family protein [Candidatus Micrarchaeia archaeon]